jgi:hypothetical protein
MAKTSLGGSAKQSGWMKVSLHCNRRLTDLAESGYCSTDAYCTCIGTKQIQNSMEVQLKKQRAAGTVGRNRRAAGDSGTKLLFIN